jgi:cytochrome c peroxidase
MNVGGNMFQRFGIFPYSRAPADGGKSGLARVDLGRFQVTRVERDRHVFRVPSLRNVALTAPYFHDGQAATLESAVDTMAQVQLGKTLTSRGDRLDRGLPAHPDRGISGPAAGGARAGMRRE